MRLGDVKKRLDSKLSELMNVQVPSSTKAVTEQQVTCMADVFFCGPGAAACTTHTACASMHFIFLIQTRTQKKSPAQFFSRPLFCCAPSLDAHRRRVQAANAKLLDALRSRMLDVGASRSANRLPSLELANGDGSSAASAAILQSISSQLEVSRRMLQFFF